VFAAKRANGYPLSAHPDVDRHNSFARHAAQMKAFESGRRGNPTGGSIAIFILPSVSAGHGLPGNFG
jgi:hypothetical protein